MVRFQGLIHIIGSKDALEEGRQGQGAEIVSGEDPSHPHQTSEEGERLIINNLWFLGIDCLKQSNDNKKVLACMKYLVQVRICALEKNKSE